MSGDHKMNQTDSGWRKRQIALDKKAENARELGLDYEPDKTVIEMAEQSSLSRQDWWKDDEALKRFAEQVREEAQAEEREKLLRLWMLLDDVDTADDIAKTDDAVYRSLCRQAHGKRWNVMTSAEVDAAIRARGQA